MFDYWEKMMMMQWARGSNPPSFLLPMFPFKTVMVEVTCTLYQFHALFFLKNLIFYSGSS